MLNNPTISDTQIAACLSADYGFTTLALEFVPGGYDTYATVYRVTTDDRPYFLKLKHAMFNPISAKVPHALQSAGIPEVVAPTPTLSGALWSSIDTTTVLVYPFIDGDNGMNTAMTDDHWFAFGQILKRIHTIAIADSVVRHIPREDFIPSPYAMSYMDQLPSAISTHPLAHPTEREAAEVWHSKQDEITLLIERSTALSHLMRQRDLPFVLCHADIHTANLLIDRDHNLHIVDWDHPIFAPIERDLMFIDDLDLQRMSVGEKTTVPFFRGYGDTPIDPLTLAYYRYTRVLEDVAFFAAPIFLMPASDEATKADSLNILKVQFAPDSMLEAAHHLYSTLFP
jgi:spectinomycin phosphotransferase